MGGDTEQVEGFHLPETPASQQDDHGLLTLLRFPSESGG